MESDITKKPTEELKSKLKNTITPKEDRKGETEKQKPDGTVENKQQNGKLKIYRVTNYTLYN